MRNHIHYEMKKILTFLNFLFKIQFKIHRSYCHGNEKLKSTYNMSNIQYVLRQFRSEKVHFSLQERNNIVFLRNVLSQQQNVIEALPVLYWQDLK